MKYSEMLKGAKSAIEDDKEFYLCIALMSIYKNNSESLRENIATRLGGRSTVGSWLAMRGVPEMEMSSTNQRFYRLRWIDSMIAEFEAEGN